MQSLKITTIDFDTILDVWNTKLWPSRQSKIKSLSSIAYGGGHDMSIYEKYEPTFWAAYIEGKIVGVNSGFRTSDTHYRSRGIWVDPACRGLGIAQFLFFALEEQAIKEGCTYLWSMPRKSAFNAYAKYGFVKTTPWFDEGVEYGPNCFVLKEI